MFKRFIILVSLVSSVFASEPIVLQLAWKYQFQFAGYIMAKEKHFYEEAGIDVVLKEYEADMEVNREVLAGRAQFGIGRSDLVLDRLNENMPFVQMLAICQASPVILQSLKRDDIKTLKDLKDKRFVLTGDGLQRDTAEIISMLHSVGIQENEIIKVSGTTYGPEDIIEGRGDVITAYSTITPHHLRELGYEPVSFAPKDYGFDFYSDILFTTDRYVQTHPDTVAKFYEATLKGWEYAFSHIDETVDVIRSRYNTQNLSAELLHFEAQELKKLAYVPNIPLGDINPIKIEKIVNSLKLLGLTQNPTLDFEPFIYQHPSKQAIYFTPEEKAYIRDNAIVRVGTPNTLAPFAYKDNTGLNMGIAYDLLKLISQRTGLQFAYVEKAYGLYHELLHHDLEMLVMVPHKPLSEVRYSANIISLQESLFKNTTNASDTVKTIGYIEPFSGANHYLKELYPHSVLTPFTSLAQAFDALKTSSIDLLYAPYASVVYRIQQDKMDSIQVIKNQNLPTTLLPIAISEQNPLLYSIISKAVRTISTDEKEAIYNKWQPVVFEKPLNLRLIWQVGGVVTLIFTILLYSYIMVTRANKKLKRKEKALQKAHQLLKEKSQKDALSGAYNRGYFSEISKQYFAIAKRENSSLCVAMFDIDNFKMVNDTYGHAIGDEAIKALARTLQTQTRTSDIVARFGGEEFIVLLPNTPLESAHSLIERVRLSAEQLVVKVDEEHYLKFTVSVGISCLNDSHLSEEVLIKEADHALYEAKHSGKNRVVLYSVV